MVTKLKNIIKKIPMFISIAILIIAGLLIILLSKNGIYHDASKGIEYGQSAAYARHINSDIKKICAYENDIIDGAKKEKSIGKDFSYLYAKMYIGESVEISIDYEAHNSPLNSILQNIAYTVNSNKMMMQTYDVRKKTALTNCIKKYFNTSTKRIVSVSNYTDLINAAILDSNGYKYKKMFDYEAGDSAVVILIYKVSVFNKLKTNWNTFCTFIKVINTLTFIAIIYLLYVHLIVKKHIKMYVKILKQVFGTIKSFLIGHVYYPLNTKKGVKILFACSVVSVALLTVVMLIITASAEYFTNLVPVGCSLNTLSDWVPSEWYDYAYFVTHLNYETLFVTCFLIYFIIFGTYHYFSSKIISSCRLLEDNIEKLYSGNYKLDTSAGTHTAFYDTLTRLSNIGEGFEKNLNEKIRSERMKTELITNVSHDLKTPLTSIISYVDLLERRDDLPPEAIDYVKIISKKAVRLKNMVYDVFELAKTASGELVIAKASLSLNKLIVQTLTDMEDTVKKSGLDIKLKIPEKDVLIISDGSRIYRVMQNIMENALKYSLKGTRIYITESTENNTVKLTIKNTASYEMDFTEEEILERFVRGDKSRNTDGNGLGLSIAKEFTTACGGTFNIKIDGDQFNVIISFPIETDTIPEAESVSPENI